MHENSYVSFKFHYRLSRKIPFSELSDNAPNVEFVKVDNYLKNPGLLLQGFFLALAKRLPKMTLPTKRSGSASRKKRKHLRPNRNEMEIRKKITTWTKIRGLQSKISVLGIAVS